MPLFLLLFLLLSLLFSLLLVFFGLLGLLYADFLALETGNLLFLLLLDLFGLHCLLDSLLCDLGLLLFLLMISLGLPHGPLLRPFLLNRSFGLLLSLGLLAFCFSLLGLRLGLGLLYGSFLVLFGLSHTLLSLLLSLLDLRFHFLLASIFLLLRSALLQKIFQ